MNRNFNINGLHPARADAGWEPARARTFVPLVDGSDRIESVTEEQSMQNGPAVATAGRTNKGGRPRKSYDYLIGTVPRTNLMRRRHALGVVPTQSAVCATS